ncbi:MAG: hypothetical protein K2X01_03955 [Cyanobacteria bacterium]|nr:hypothetical protein [Cyanobacteriota bacterium]
MVSPVPEVNLDADALASASKSVLFRAAVDSQQAVAPSPSTETVGTPIRSGFVAKNYQTDTGGPIAFSATDILDLINRINRTGVTYESLQAYPISYLNNAEREILFFLLRNERFFNTIAGLTGTEGVLTPEDIKVAKTLVGNTLHFTPDELLTLSTHTQVDANKPVNELNQAPRTFSPEQVLQVLKKVSPDQLLTLPQLEGLSALHSLSAEEQAVIRFLQSRPVDRILSQLVQHENGRVTPEVIRILTSLAFNPLVYGQAPLLLYKDANKDEMEDTTKVNPIKGDDNPFFRNARHFDWNQPDAVQRLELSAHELIAVLKDINPTGPVSLELLRHHHPKNELEARVLQALSQHSIFQALAGLDGEDATLSIKDIKLAMLDHTLVLMDEHLTLVLVP